MLERWGGWKRCKLFPSVGTILIMLGHLNFGWMKGLLEHLVCWNLQGLKCIILGWKVFFYLAFFFAWTMLDFGWILSCCYGDKMRSIRCLHFYLLSWFYLGFSLNISLMELLNVSKQKWRLPIARVELCCWRNWAHRLFFLEKFSG